MAVLQLTVVLLTLAGLSSSPASATEPCTNKSCELKYKNFVHKHVLKQTFDRNALDAWESYLKAQKLWCLKNRPVQSFVEESQNVEAICSSGWRVGGNLCISKSKMEVYDIITTFDNNGKCTITRKKRQTFVVVACDKVGNRCLPVHFERYRNQTPSNIPC